jgi:hypothetical protein
MQADSPRGNAAIPAPGAGLGRSFLTIRLQPHPRAELSFNHNYLRGLPTFDPQLIGTGLLDKYLFQGLSAGARVEVIKQFWLYTNLGRSNRTYSRFNSGFGHGAYRSVSVSRTLQERFRLELMGGDQTFASLATLSNRFRFVNLNLDGSFGAHYFVQGGVTVSRGQLQSYDQWMVTFGYRFDSKTGQVR